MEIAKFLEILFSRSDFALQKSSLENSRFLWYIVKYLSKILVKIISSSVDSKNKIFTSVTATADVVCSLILSLSFFIYRFASLYPNFVVNLQEVGIKLISVFRYLSRILSAPSGIIFFSPLTPRTFITKLVSLARVSSWSDIEHRP